MAHSVQKGFITKDLILGGGGDLAAVGVDLIQIVCPLAGFTTAVVYRSSLILHRPQMTPRRVFISTRGDSFTGKHLGCCNHNFISLFLVESSLDDWDAVAGRERGGTSAPSSWWGRLLFYSLLFLHPLTLCVPQTLWPQHSANHSCSLSALFDSRRSLQTRSSPLGPSNPINPRSKIPTSTLH